jgi:hypothetical protein
LKLEWNDKEIQYDRYWLELRDDNDNVIRSVLLVDCRKIASYDVIKYKYSGVTITNDVTLEEAKEEVERYFLGWWEKQLNRAERDYDEAFEVVEFLKGELNDSN